ncbi:MAG: hypothetical protein HGA96_06225 [Desulfobulbaceae bacterium]|nr:hypothetical protein [Desulfobulbaceae bacterium]
MQRPFDDGIDGLELALLLGISEEMAQEELEQLLEELAQEHPDPDIIDDDGEPLPGL